MLADAQNVHQSYLLPGSLFWLLQTAPDDRSAAAPGEGKASQSTSNRAQCSNVIWRNRRAYQWTNKPPCDVMTPASFH
jgi:hypothetical protein